MLDVIEHLVGAERGTNLFFRKYPPNEATRSMKLKNHFLFDVDAIGFDVSVQISCASKN